LRQQIQQHVGTEFLDGEPHDAGECLSAILVAAGLEPAWRRTRTWVTQDTELKLRDFQRHQDRFKELQTVPRQPAPSWWVVEPRQGRAVVLPTRFVRLDDDLISLTMEGVQYARKVHMELLEAPLPDYMVYEIPRARQGWQHVHHGAIEAPPRLQLRPTGGRTQTHDQTHNDWHLVGVVVFVTWPAPHYVSLIRSHAPDRVERLWYLYDNLYHHGQLQGPLGLQALRLWSERWRTHGTLFLYRQM